MLTIIRTCFLERKTRLAPRFSPQKTRADNGQNRTRYVNNHCLPFGLNYSKKRQFPGIPGIPGICQNDS
jgi:hypothetical protein